jgi:predicted TPR repeat methyltransferase
MSLDNEFWRKIYSPESPEELKEAYAEWAEEYDEDLDKNYGYVAPRVGAEALDRALDDKSARILDAGAGTGLVGLVLSGMGYTNIDALDFSAEMLAEAEKKGVYQRLLNMDMSRPLDIEDDAYDAVICVGTFTYGHVEPSALDELIRITRPGGLVCFSVREGAYEEHGYRPRMLELETAGKWELAEMRDEPSLVKENVGAKVCTFRVADRP